MEFTLTLDRAEAVGGSARIHHVSHVVGADMLLQVILLGGAEIAELALDFALFLVGGANVLEQVVRLLGFVRAKLAVQRRAVRFTRGMDHDVPQQRRLKTYQNVIFFFLGVSAG